MPPQNHVPTVCPRAGADTRRLARRLIVAVAAVVLGLLPGVQGLAPARPAVVQAAQRDQPTTGLSASGTAASASPSRSERTRDALDNAVVSTGAPDEQLDMRAELDRGARLFLLRSCQIIT
jgi:hypothetical protein